MKNNKLSEKMRIISWLVIAIGAASLISFLYNLIILYRGYMGLEKLTELFVTTPLFLITGLSFFIPGVLILKTKKNYWLIFVIIGLGSIIFYSTEIVRLFDSFL